MGAAQEDLGGAEKSHKRGVMARLRAYLLAGLVVTAPVSATFYIIWLVIDAVDRLVAQWLPVQYNPQTYIAVDVPGLGLVLVVVALTVIGFLTANVLGRLVVGLGERILNKMPVVRSLYSALKQIFQTVFSGQSKAFREVVLIEYPRRGVWTMAFLTGETSGEVQRVLNGTVLNVFVPTTPNPTSGFLLFVPESDVVHVSMSVEDGLKMIISGGIITPPEKTLLTELL
jgi:uncharacterized membrane protein